MTQRKMAHRIRLRKPWQRHDHPARLDDHPARMDDVTGAAGATDHPEPAAASVIRVDVPDRSPIDIARPPDDTHRVYRVTYCRKFHRPSGIGPDDRVQLAIGAVAGRIAEIRINAVTVSGQQVPTANESQQAVATTMQLSLDGRLANHNELEIELESTADAPGPPRLLGDVNLWITPSSR